MDQFLVNQELSFHHLTMVIVNNKYLIKRANIEGFL
jgi:hypothetical protein